MGPMRRRLSSSVELPCPFCGELGSIFLDEGGGEHQTYVEDCAVCCRPRVVHIESIADAGQGPRVWLERDDGA
jgi:Cysteine-rich CPXCG